MIEKQLNIADPWESLRAFTAARIAQGRAGDSIPLARALEFKLAHAHARDAVYSLLDKEKLISELQGFSVLSLHSRAENRQQYLQRPDLGRVLDERSIQIINDNAFRSDVCLVLADGLSANAINLNAIKLLEGLVDLFKSLKYSLAPVCIAEQARVALGDEIAYKLGSKLCIMLIGERPGLSAADSIGAYITYDPRPGLTDESRNCVSNIRPQGLPSDLAARKIFYLVQEALKLQLSGVALKDNAGALGLE